MDSTELALCRRTPESAILAAAIMYVSVIRRNSAIGTTSRHRTNTSRVCPRSSCVMKIDLKMVMMKRIAAMSIKMFVMVWVSICSGVFFDVNFLALLSIWEA